MRNKQMNWLLAVSAVALLGTAVVTLRAAEQATQQAAISAVRGGPASAAEGPASNLDAASPAPAGATKQHQPASLQALPAGTAGAMSHAAAPTGGMKQHPPASAPEESASITDDPTTAPDPSQSADNNVSFPTDI
jgi:hypothetical protein